MPAQQPPVTMRKHKLEAAADIQLCEAEPATPAKPAESAAQRPGPAALEPVTTKSAPDGIAAGKRVPQPAAAASAAKPAEAAECATAVKPAAAAQRPAAAADTAATISPQPAPTPDKPAEQRSRCALPQPKQPAKPAPLTKGPRHGSRLQQQSLGCTLSRMTPQTAVQQRMVPQRMLHMR